MELEWTTPILIAAIALVAWFWQDSLRVRERANAAAIEACNRLALQFLDGTVAFTSLRVVRDAGHLRLRRTYIFDYTAHSIERLHGFVVLLGMRVESVGFARDETQHRPLTTMRTDVVADQPPACVSPMSAGPVPPETKPDEGGSDGEGAAGNVLNLDDWRRDRHRH